MKPLLIIPPAPARWAAVHGLLRHVGPPWLPDLERRFNEGVAGAQDAYAFVPSGGLLVASAGINKRGPLGVLVHAFTRADHRGRGLARQVTEAVLSWFDMTGGKWLYLTTTAELDAGLYAKFGFAPLHRAVWAPHDRLVMVRARGVSQGPLEDVGGAVQVRAVSAMDWPAMVALLQCRPGPDPRVPLAESAVNAEALTLDLLAHAQRGTGHLLGAFVGETLIGLASVALEQPGDRTYAILIPHSGVPEELRAATHAAAHEKGYADVHFPMEALSATNMP